MTKDNDLKEKLVKKGVAVLLAGTIIATVFTGCGKNDKTKTNLLEDTILYNTEIVYVDNQPLIMRCYYPGKYSNNCSGKHYQDIVSGRVYHIKNENSEKNDVCHYVDINNLAPDTKREPITPYLTSEEIEKAKEGKFTDADAIAVEQRIMDQSKTR